MSRLADLSRFETNIKNKFVKVLTVRYSAVLQLKMFDRDNLGRIFVKPACGEQDSCYNFCSMYMCCVYASRFVWAITCTFVHGFQNNFTQLFSLISRLSNLFFCTLRSRDKEVCQGVLIYYSLGDGGMEFLGHFVCKNFFFETF